MELMINMILELSCFGRSSVSQAADRESSINPAGDISSLMILFLNKYFLSSFHQIALS